MTEQKKRNHHHLDIQQLNTLNPIEEKKKIHVFNNILPFNSPCVIKSHYYGLQGQQTFLLPANVSSLPRCNLFSESRMCPQASFRWGMSETPLLEGIQQALWPDVQNTSAFLWPEGIQIYQNVLQSNLISLRWFLLFCRINSKCTSTITFIVPFRTIATRQGDLDHNKSDRFVVFPPIIVFWYFQTREMDCCNFCRSCSMSVRYLT